MITSIIARKKSANRAAETAEPAPAPAGVVEKAGVAKAKPPTLVQLNKQKKDAENAATQREGRPSKKGNIKWNWEFSWAKEILRKAIMNGDITEEHTLDEIHKWHPEIEATDRTKLSGRIRGIKQQVKQDDRAAKQDDIDLSNDRKLYPVPAENYRGEPRWEGSKAQETLKADIALGLHLTMKPSKFADWDVFNEYDPNVIREHIYQEIKFQKYCLYRKEKKKKKIHIFSP